MHKAGPPYPGHPLPGSVSNPLWVQIWGVPATGGWKEKIEREVVHQRLPGLGRNVHERNQPKVRILPTSNLSFIPLSLKLQPYRFMLHFPTFFHYSQEPDGKTSSLSPPFSDWKNHSSRITTAKEFPAGPWWWWGGMVPIEFWAPKAWVFLHIPEETEFQGQYDLILATLPGKEDTSVGQTWPSAIWLRICAIRKSLYPSLPHLIHTKDMRIYFLFNPSSLHTKEKRMRYTGCCVLISVTRLVTFPLIFLPENRRVDLSPWKQCSQPK